MPRAHRYALDGQVVHVTHRCHNREFLLKLRELRTEAIAVGSKEYVEEFRGKYPKRSALKYEEPEPGTWAVREEKDPYNTILS